jgi:uncharacterized protein (TIGR02118 family)
MIHLTVLYPQPSDSAQFDADYKIHLDLLHEKLGIPKNEQPYKLTRFLPGPTGKPLFYQMFSFPFESLEALNAAMSTDEMQEVAVDAGRISTGGEPIIMVGQ